MQANFKPARTLNQPLLAALLATSLLSIPLSSIAQKLEKTLSPTKSNTNVAVVDRIIAVVNNEVITQNELQERMNVVLKQMQKAGTTPPSAEVFTKQLLERQINEMVQLLEAKESGVRIDDATLEASIKNYADGSNVSMSDFRELIERDGLKWSKFREDVRNDLMVMRIREREVDANINVTDAEVDTQLALESKEANSDKEFRLAHILVVVPEQATSEQIEVKRKKALQALSELRRGAEFAQISAQYSDAPDALQGGNLGWRPAGRLPAIFLESLNALKQGEITDILRSPNGFHIVKLLDKRGVSAAPTITQTNTRHILIRNKDGLTDDEAKSRLSRLRERIATGADFAELAKVHSDDASATKGGDLGWLAPGAAVPEFERVMTQLRDNEVSQPIQTPFGWHLVQVLGRRTEGVSNDRKRETARGVIRQRKGDEAYQDWVRQIRDRAFVEYRLDEK